jgi:methionyl-tRNA formyltransferase
MQITLLCTDPLHPVVASLLPWRERMSAAGHAVALVHDKQDLPGGDVLFLVSCSQIIGAREKALYRATLVLHASDLPRGRGWSPYIWAVLDGAARITVSLLEAAEPVDSGRIWLKTGFDLEGHELLDEIHTRLFAAELDLMSQAVERFDAIAPQAQSGEPGPYLPRRSPADSRLDPQRPLAEQFDLLRVVDNQRFPAWFEFRGQRYKITITKDEDA